MVKICVEFVLRTIHLNFRPFANHILAKIAGACYCSSTYIAEICSPEHRGPLLGFLEPTFTFGVLLCNLLVHNLGWRASAYGYIAGSVLCLLLFALLPESPSWLVCRGRRERAAEILGWLRGCPREAERELVEIENATAEPAGGGRRPARALLGDALRSWQPLALLVGLVALQRACGCPVLESYTVRFFDALRLPPSAAVDSAAAAIYHSTANFAASFCTPFAVQRLPRRTLLALSGLVMGVSMAAVALYELRFAGRPAAAAGPPHYWALLAAVYAYDVASTLGVLPLPFVMSGELFPAEGRGLLNGLYCCFSFLISAAVVKAFPGFLAAAGIVAVTGSYALVCFATILYAQFLLPETRGKTLPEIQARYFKRGREYATTLDVD